jgi:hypothetical protein
MGHGDGDPRRISHRFHSRYLRVSARFLDIEDAMALRRTVQEMLRALVDEIPPQVRKTYDVFVRYQLRDGTDTRRIQPTAFVRHAQVNTNKRAASGNGPAGGGSMRQRVHASFSSGGVEKEQ